MRIEDYEEKLNLIEIENEKIKEMKKHFSNTIKIDLILLVLIITIVPLCFVGLYYQKNIPFWLTIVCWVLAAASFFGFFGLLGIIFGLLANIKESKKEYKDTINNLKCDLNLYKNTAVELDSLDDYNFLINNKFCIGEKKFYYSENTSINYESFEDVNDEDKVVLEEYE